MNIMMSKEQLRARLGCDASFSLFELLALFNIIHASYCTIQLTFNIFFFYAISKMFLVSTMVLKTKWIK